ncbi:methyl-accepting chemotaxis protein [Rhodobacter sp. CZR27]|uniref:methyl-accepting chemotaxis protein n=1 Tax=Rhodobacter sp. CZR27 TaxID=2033869 RepID=UPI001E38316B|nr:methyl-accepting chemotaxis protein [Rhodobacter sp. CZR27]
MALDEGARRLQHLYVSANPKPVGDKHRLDDAGDGSAYSAAHRRHHPFLRGYLERFGLYDLFLIEPESGTILYSVFKETDFATSLFSGPYRDSAFARAAQAMAKEGGREPVLIADFEPYAPSYNTHAGFILLPLQKDGALAGILAFQIPIEPLNEIMRRKLGRFETSDGYLVGADGRLRSIPRLAAGLEVGAPVAGPVVAAALAGKAERLEGANYGGQQMVAAVRPVRIGGMTWGIVSEIAAEEAFAEARAALRSAGVTAAAWAGLILIAGLLVSAWLIRPIRRLSRSIEDHAGRAVEALRTASTRAAAAAEKMVVNAEESGRQIRQVRESSGIASTNVATVASAVEEMSASVQEVVQGVIRTSRLIEETTARTGAAQASLEALESATGRIRGVVAFIEGIARKTDLLALNAAVEAARAGEAGRGFAVVAEEVRKLAALTTSSTGEIAAEVGAVTGAVEANGAAVRGIVEAVGQVQAQARLISVAAGQQGGVAAEIASRLADTAERVSRVDHGIAGVEEASADAAATGTGLTAEMETMGAAAAGMDAGRDRLRRDGP